MVSISSVGTTVRVAFVVVVGLKVQSEILGGSSPKHLQAQQRERGSGVVALDAFIGKAAR
jgi:hypothetical protein